MIESDAIDAEVYKFAMDEELNERITKEFRIYLRQLYKTLSCIFGDIQVSNLKEVHMAAIEERVAELAKSMICKVECHHISQAIKQSDSTTANLIKEVIGNKNKKVSNKTNKSTKRKVN